MSDAFIGRRSDYQAAELAAETLRPDPIVQLRDWLQEAVAQDVIEPSAMCLSTVSREGRPSSRMVLLRGLDSRGLRFFTNYESRKALELSGNPAAALCFWWGELERQVRVEGHVERLSSAESDAYFAGRPRKSRLASAASPQSRPIPDREALERRMAELDAQFPEEVPRPPHWGGYLLVPDRFEFWQGRRARLHDRFVYDRTAESWQITRLAP